MTSGSRLSWHSSRRQHASSLRRQFVLGQSKRDLPKHLEVHTQTSWQSEPRGRCWRVRAQSLQPGPSLEGDGSAAARDPDQIVGAGQPA